MFSIAEADFGTPASVSTKRVTLSIDGFEISVPEGTSIMRAAALAGTSIPKLCATDTLDAFGSCRLCLVEIDGRKGMPASCTTLVEEGMKVHTQSERLARLRRGVMELYLSDHPRDSMTSPTGTHNELYMMAGIVGLREIRYGYDGDDHVHTHRADGSANSRFVAKDESNPYFTFDASKCIVCSRCVRACDEQQGTIALAIQGRGFDSKMVASQDQPFLESECVSCGACVSACPTDALVEKSLARYGQAEHSAITTCAYCGVGCSFRAEMQGDRLVRMVPSKDGRANHGHSCVKGRFALDYAKHPDRITKPMIREKITDAWREVSWDEAIQHTASEFKRIQAKYGRFSVGGITSSRCTNEETYLVQKLVRAALRNNNVDTCARVCHSPTGYGLKMTIGESAGTQDFDSILQTDVIFVIGANPTDAHPVFGSQMKRRLRQGARLIVADPRRIDLVRSPHIQADHHLQLKPGTNVALLDSIAHVIKMEGLVDEDFVKARCEGPAFEKWQAFIAKPENSPEAMAAHTGVPAAAVRAAARLYAGIGADGPIKGSGPNGRANSAIYWGLGVSEHSQGSTAVIALANLAMATGNIGRPGVGLNPLRGQNNVQGSNDMGSFPHEYSGYRHVSDPESRALFEKAWGVELWPEPGLRIPNMFDAALDGDFKALYIEGEDIAQSDPNTQHVTAALQALECVVVQDLFLNETANYAHVFLPGSSFLEKDGTFTNSERRVSRVRQVMRPLATYADWEVTQLLSNALGYPMHYKHAGEILDEIACLTPTFRGISFEKLDRLGGIQWPCDEEHPKGTPIMHIGQFVRGLGRFMLTPYIPTSERSTSRFPLLLTTGRILSHYNVGQQTRRTDNTIWYPEDVLEIHPHDAEDRGIKDGDWVGVASRVGEIVVHATISPRMQPGVVYTTFHFSETGANVVTTENSDWATNCPEYKVTAVQVTRVNQPSGWQKRHKAFTELQASLLHAGEGIAVK